MKQILVIDNYDSFTYNLVHLLEEIPQVKVAVFRNDAITIEKVDHYDGILLSPGPGLPDEAGIMPSLIQEYKNRKPILGICLGHQALGEAFGARLDNLERVYHGIQSEIEVILKKEGLFKNMSNTLAVGRYHSWVIASKSIPAEFTITAKTSDGTVMAMQHQHLPLFGVQFHPESVMTPDGKQMIENWIAHF
jgi:anthranilate synthase component 2